MPGVMSSLRAASAVIYCADKAGLTVLAGAPAAGHGDLWQCGMMRDRDAGGASLHRLGLPSLRLTGCIVFPRAVAPLCAGGECGALLCGAVLRCATTTLTGRHARLAAWTKDGVWGWWAGWAWVPLSTTTGSWRRRMRNCGRRMDLVMVHAETDSTVAYCQGRRPRRHGQVSVRLSGAVEGCRGGVWRGAFGDASFLHAELAAIPAIAADRYVSVR